MDDVAFLKVQLCAGVRLKEPAGIPLVQDSTAATAACLAQGAADAGDRHSRRTEA